MYGYVRVQDPVTALTGSMDASQTTMNVAEGQLVSRGLVEVDNELMLVKDVGVGGGITLQPYGRGQRNTVPAAHNAGTKVTVAPLYPRRRVRDVLYGVIREIFPSVYGLGEVFLDVNLVRTNYPLPEDCFDVLAVEWHVIGPSRMWTPLRRWRVNRRPGIQEIELLGDYFPGKERVRILYIKDMPDLITIDDLSVLGYAEETHDIFVLGTVARLLMYTEPARLQVQSVASHGRSEVVPAGQIKQMAQDTYALFQRRVQQEADRLLQRYASIPHYNT